MMEQPTAKPDHPPSIDADDYWNFLLYSRVRYKCVVFIPLSNRVWMAASKALRHVGFTHVLAEILHLFDLLKAKYPMMTISAILIREQAKKEKDVA